MSELDHIAWGEQGVESLAPIPTDLAGQWYVAHTRSRNEKALAWELGRMGVFNYLPLCPRTTRSPVTRRVSRSMVPVFPGYVFFHGNPEQRYQALRTNRIAQVLNVANQEQFYAELLHVHTLLVSQCDFSVAKRLKVGDWVRIVAGPLQGLEGTIARAADRWRLYLNVTTLGQSVMVEVDSESVEPIDPPAYAGITGRRPIHRV